MKKVIYYFTSIIKLLIAFENPFLISRIFLRLTAIQEHIIKLKSNGIRFHIRDGMDIWSIKETFLDRFYEKYATPIGMGWVIIDIGAGIGDFSIFAAIKHPQNVVFAFEPFSGSYNLLTKSLNLNGITNVKPFAQAVAGHSGSLVLDLTSGAPLKFQSYRIEQKPSTFNQLIVPCLSLGDLFSSLNINHCDLLKLDCEGGEYNLLYNTPDVVFECIHRIIMEYHELEDSHSHRRLIEYLKGKGYSVQSYPNVVHNYLGYIYAYK